MHSRLLEASPALAACASLSDLLRTACDTVVPDLGFERIAAYVDADPDVLELAHSRGWESPAGLSPTLIVTQVEALLAPEREHAGCWLIDAGELFAEPSPTPRSRRNGQGPAAWSDSCLVLPPARPTAPCERCSRSRTRSTAWRPPMPVAARCDYWSTSSRRVQSTLDYRDLLQHLATHDPLTGVRNRRHLTEMISEHADVALLVCDLDHFKLVNDRYGHEVGDSVLARFGGLLRELARDADVPVRLGGEEFCMILPTPTGRERSRPPSGYGPRPAAGCASSCPRASPCRSAWP